MINEMLKNLSPNKIDDDQISGLRLMLQHDTFKEYHSLIQEKLNEIDAKKKSKDEGIVVGAFKIEAGKFYITVNNSIVFCLGVAVEEGSIFRLIVVEGGYNDLELPGNLALQMFGDMRRFGCYVSNDNGLCLASISNFTYPMHIIRPIDASFKIV